MEQSSGVHSHEQRSSDRQSSDMTMPLSTLSAAAAAMDWEAAEATLAEEWQAQRDQLVRAAQSQLETWWRTRSDQLFANAPNSLADHYLQGTHPVAHRLQAYHTFIDHDLPNMIVHHGVHQNNYRGFVSRLSFSDVCLQRPQITPSDAIHGARNYTAKVVVTARLQWFIQPDSHAFWFYWCIARGRAGMKVPPGIIHHARNGSVTMSKSTPHFEKLAREHGHLVTAQDRQDTASEREEVLHNLELFELPVMVGSKLCHLRDGDALDIDHKLLHWGGYYIMHGGRKVCDHRLDRHTNSVHVVKINNERGCYSAEIRSTHPEQKHRSTSTMYIVYHTSDSANVFNQHMLHVSVPYVSKESANGLGTIGPDGRPKKQKLLRLPLGLVLYALGSSPADFVHMLRFLGRQVGHTYRRRARQRAEALSGAGLNPAAQSSTNHTDHTDHMDHTNHTDRMGDVDDVDDTERATDDVDAGLPAWYACTLDTLLCTKCDAHDRLSALRQLCQLRGKAWTDNPLAEECSLHADVLPHCNGATQSNPSHWFWTPWNESLLQRASGHASSAADAPSQPSMGKQVAPHRLPPELVKLLDEGVYPRKPKRGRPCTRPEALLLQRRMHENELHRLYVRFCAFVQSCQAQNLTPCRTLADLVSCLRDGKPPPHTVEHPDNAHCEQRRALCALAADRTVASSAADLPYGDPFFHSNQRKLWFLAQAVHKLLLTAHQCLPAFTTTNLCHQSLCMDDVILGQLTRYILKQLLDKAGERLTTSFKRCEPVSLRKVLVLDKYATEYLKRFSSGKPTPNRDGSVFALTDHNLFATLNMLRRVSNTLKGHDGVHTRDRKLCAPGMLCAPETPESKDCGMVHSMATGCYVSQLTDVDAADALVRQELADLIVPLGVDTSSPTASAIDTSQLNGHGGLIMDVHQRICGWSLDLEACRRRLVCARRRGLLPHGFEVWYHPLERVLRMDVSTGRLMTTLVVLEEYERSDTSVVHTFDQRLEAWLHKYRQLSQRPTPHELLTHGWLEYVGSNELLHHCVVCRVTRDYRSGYHTHLSALGFGLFGYTAASLPSAHKMPGARFCLGVQQHRQRISLGKPDLTSRKRSWSQYAEASPYQTQLFHSAGLDTEAHGVNVLVGIRPDEAGNTEDAVTMRRGWLEQGGMRHLWVRCEAEEQKPGAEQVIDTAKLRRLKSNQLVRVEGLPELLKLQNTTLNQLNRRHRDKRQKLYERPDSVRASRLKEEGSYHTLDPVLSVATARTRLNGGDALVGVTVHDRPPTTSAFVMLPPEMRQSDSGERSCRSMMLPSHLRSAQVVRHVAVDGRRAVDYLCGHDGRLGDKGACVSQKGVLGRVIDDVDMPFDADTGRPFDLLLSPLAVIGRTTCNVLDEMAVHRTAVRVGLPVVDRQNYDHDRAWYARLLSSGVTDDSPAGPQADVRTAVSVPIWEPGHLGDAPRLISGGNVSYGRLSHLAENKAHARGGNGAYSKSTRQPNPGRTSMGGFRYGWMERIGEEGHGASAVLWDRFCAYSDGQRGVHCLRCNELCVNMESLQTAMCLSCCSTDPKDLKPVIFPFTTRLIQQELAMGGLHLQMSAKPVQHIKQV